MASTTIVLNGTPQSVRNAVCNAIKYASLYAPAGDVEDMFYTDMFDLLEQLNAQCDKQPISVPLDSEAA